MNKKNIGCLCYGFISNNANEGNYYRKSCDIFEQRNVKFWRLVMFCFDMLKCLTLKFSHTVFISLLDLSGPPEKQQQSLLVKCTLSFKKRHLKDENCLQIKGKKVASKKQSHVSLKITP